MWLVGELLCGFKGLLSILVNFLGISIGKEAERADFLLSQNISF